MMDAAGEFLDLFRRLESTMREITLSEGGAREFNSLLGQLARTDPFIQQRWDEIDLCRQVRNLLSHFPSIEGRGPVVPDTALIEVLQQTLEHIEHPVRAIDAAIPMERVYTVTMDTDVPGVLRQMRQRGYSHVPVVENKEVKAVFSTGTVFSAACREMSFHCQQGLKIKDFLPDILLDRHENERYLFVAADTPLFQVKELFQKPKQASRKVAVVFVTGSGREDDALLGLITPWDAIQAMEA